MLPLHHACAHGHASPAATLALLRAYPGAAQARAVGGLLCLHLACDKRGEHTAEIVTLLLDAGSEGNAGGWPGAASSPDRRGRLPLHAAAASGAGVSVARALLAADRKAASATDAAGATPAHYAAATAESAETLVLLLDVHGQARALATNSHPSKC